MSHRPAPAARLIAVIACLAVAAAGVRGWSALYQSAGGPSWQRRSLLAAGEPGWWALLGMFVLMAAVAIYTARRFARRAARRRVSLHVLEPWLRLWVVVLVLAMIPLLVAGLGLAAYALSRPPQTDAPAAVATETASAQAPDPSATPAPTILIVVAAAAFAIVAGLVAAAWTGRSGPVAVRQVLAPPALAGLAAALDVAAAALARTTADGPRAAVIGCYAAMEESLRSTAAAPAASDTPTEVLRRAVAEGLLRGPAAARLTELFAEARYSHHPFTAEHQQAAAGALRTVRQELSTAVGSTA